jgi:bacterioferritin-associated ferredoxin
MLCRMYICICNGHRECDIRDAAREGLRSAPEIYRRLGKPVRCGRCLEVATQVIEEVHATNDGGEISEVA